MLTSILCAVLTTHCIASHHITVLFRYADLTSLVFDFIKQFEEICKQPTVTVEDMSRAVLQIYEDADDRITNEPLWQTVDDVTAEAVADGFQKHVMSTIYELVFSANEDDEAKDLNLQERIREFRWIEPSHLDAVCDLSNEAVVEEFYKAQEKLIIMDAQRPPQDKLTCVVEASKAIFGILEKSSGGTNSAAVRCPFFSIDQGGSLAFLVYIIIYVLFFFFFWFVCFFLYIYIYSIYIYSMENIYIYYIFYFL